MTDKQAEFVMVPRKPTPDMLEHMAGMSEAAWERSYRLMLAAAPRYQPQGDAVEMANEAYELAYEQERHHGATSEHAARAGIAAALQAAYPELVAEVARLRDEVARQSDEVTRLRQEAGK